MRIFLILLLACFITNCEDGEHKKPDRLPLKSVEKESKSGRFYPNLIVPGSHLGSIKIGELAKKVYDSLGAADAGDAAMQKALASWNFDQNKAMLTIFTAVRDLENGDHRVYVIRSKSADFKTENDLGVNSPITEIKEQFLLQKQGFFTENGQKFTLYETDKGIGFEFDEQEICRAVVIHEPDAKSNETYLPIYADFQFTKSPK